MSTARKLIARDQSAVESPTVVSRGDELPAAKYVAGGVPTITDLIQRSGGRTVIASAKTVGLCWIDMLKCQALRSPSPIGAMPMPRASRSSGVRRFRVIFLCQSLPRLARSHLHIYNAMAGRPKRVTDLLWKDGVPPLSVIWLGEPDLTEHESALARHPRSLRSNRRMKIWLLFFRP